MVAALALALVSAQSDRAKQGTSWIKEVLRSPMERMAKTYIEYTLGSVVQALTHNPTFYCIPGDAKCAVTPKGIDLLMNKWIHLLVPFYMVAMLFSAIFFLLKAGTPRGRARARSMAVKLIFGMALVALSPVIYQTLLETSVVLVQFFLTGYATELNLGLMKIPINAQIFPPVGQPEINNMTWALDNTGLTMSWIFMYVACGTLILGNIVLWFRNMMVYFYGVFFPVILFLYTFEVTKPQGEKWLNGSLKWIFAPVLQALLLAFTVQIANNISMWNFTGTVGSVILGFISNSLTGMIILAGISGFIMGPMIVGQVMSWFGDAISSVGLGTGNQWMVSIGNLLAGGGSGSVLQAEAELARASSYERYRSMMTDRSTPGTATLRQSHGASGVSSSQGSVSPGYAASGDRIPSGGQQSSQGGMFAASSPTGQLRSALSYKPGSGPNAGQTSGASGEASSDNSPQNSYAGTLSGTGTGSRTSGTGAGTGSPAGSQDTDSGEASKASSGFNQNDLQAELDKSPESGSAQGSTNSGDEQPYEAPSYGALISDELNKEQISNQTKALSPETPDAGTPQGKELEVKMASAGGIPSIKTPKEPPAGSTAMQAPDEDSEMARLAGIAADKERELTGQHIEQKQTMEGLQADRVQRDAGRKQAETDGKAAEKKEAAKRRNVDRDQ